jgi:hypothetical protein
MEKRMMTSLTRALVLLLLGAALLPAQEESAETPTLDDVRYEARRSWNKTRRALDRELAASPEKSAEIEAKRRAALAATLQPLWAALEAQPNDADAPKALIWILRLGKYDPVPAQKAAKLFARRHAEHEEAYKAAKYLARSQGAAWAEEPLKRLAKAKNERTSAWARYALEARALIRAKTADEETLVLNRIQALAAACEEQRDVIKAIDLLTRSYRFAPGRPAPEIEGVDLDGTAFKLSDYRGKVVLIDFWGTW